MEATPTSELPKLLDLAMAEMQASTAELVDQYFLQDAAEYRLDWNAGTLTFGDAVFDVQLVGGFDSQVGHWRWSWADPNLPRTVTLAAAHAHAFGKANDITSLTTATIPATENDCWKWAAFAGMLLKWPGIYRIPLQTGNIIFVAFRPQEGTHHDLITPSIA